MKRMYFGIAVAVALCVMLSACGNTPVASDSAESSSVSDSDSVSTSDGLASSESADSGDGDSSDGATSEVLYLKSETESNRNGVLMVLSYRYDENGRRVESVEERPGQDTVTTVFTYDKNGWVIAEERTSTQESYNYKAEFTLDEHGNPIQIIRTRADGSQSVFSCENEYDDQGRLIKATEYDGDEVSECTEYEYSDTYELPVKEVYTIGTTLYSTTVRDFDSMAEEGLYVETINYPRTATGQPGEKICHYRISDGLIVYSYDATTGNKPDELTYEYDEHGNQTSVAGVRSARDIHDTTEYTYDEAGHVLSSQKTSNNGSPLESWAYEYAPLDELLYVK